MLYLEKLEGESIVYKEQLKIDFIEMEICYSLRWHATKISKKADKTNSWGVKDKICLDFNFNISIIM